MTTYQLFALLFPVAVFVAVGLTALGIVRWVNWKYPRQPATELETVTVELEAEDHATGAAHLGKPGISVNEEAVRDLDEASHLIQRVRRQLQRTS
jgi:hypothetical protein